MCINIQQCNFLSLSFASFYWVDSGHSSLIFQLNQSLECCCWISHNSSHLTPFTLWILTSGFIFGELLNWNLPKASTLTVCLSSHSLPILFQGFRQSCTRHHLSTYWCVGESKTHQENKDALRSHGLQHWCVFSSFFSTLQTERALKHVLVTSTLFLVIDRDPSSWSEGEIYIHLIPIQCSYFIS